MRTLWRKAKERSGQSLVEYALILALVSIVVIAALSVLGERTKNTFELVDNALQPK